MCHRRMTNYLLKSTFQTNCLAEFERKANLLDVALQTIIFLTHEMIERSPKNINLLQNCKVCFRRFVPSGKPELTSHWYLISLYHLQS